MSTNIKPLTAQQHELLRYIEQEYLISSFVPTKDAAVAKEICSAAFYTKCLGDTNFRKAMEARGISMRGFDGVKDNGVLTAEQLTVANIMLDLRDNRSQKNKLKDCNVPTQKWEAWLREPAFQNYLRARAESALGDNLHESHLALVERVRSGDINAIKYFNEITGRYVPNATGQVDVNAILMRVLEIIQKHVKDSVAIANVADDLMALSTINPALMGVKSGQTLGTRVIEGAVAKDTKEPFTSL